MNKQKVLHDKGLKTTSARLAVLDFLDKKKKPVDVLTVVESLNNQVDQATVYRIIDILTENNIVDRLEFGEGKYRYEIAGNHHHHLVCTSCGLIEEVEGTHLKEFEENIKKKNGFLVKSHSLEFFGICKNCQS